MRWILLASALTGSHALPDDVQEILAQGLTEKWLVSHMAKSAIFGSHHMRARRQAECVDKHTQCPSYVNFCENSQFQLTCPKSCNACGTEEETPVETSESENDVADSESDQ